jgi:D-serine deaminase-like pyridoxal phosphate-dependent protein
MQALAHAESDAPLEHDVYPHVQTSDSIDIAKQQIAAGAMEVTVSNLKEAEQFFEAGIKDIINAVEIAQSRHTFQRTPQ